LVSTPEHPLGTTEGGGPALSSHQPQGLGRERNAASEVNGVLVGEKILLEFGVSAIDTSDAA
jgi:hypothetical protein